LKVTTRGTIGNLVSAKLSLGTNGRPMEAEPVERP